MKILTNKHLFERPLGNYLFSVPALLEWAKAKGHFLSTEPQIDGYDLAQVESVLCAIERATAPNLDDAMDMVAANPRLAGHRAADDAHLSRWLVGAEAHRLWREEFTRAIDDGELKLFDAISRMPVRWPLASTGVTEKAMPEKPVPMITPAADFWADDDETGELLPDDKQGNAATLKQEQKADADEELAKLFDPVKAATLGEMFHDYGKWTGYAERAKRNGLSAAKVGRSLFNPYRAAVWWVSQGPPGWDWARCLRVLANNLPARSLDSKHLLTGEFD